MTDIIFTRYWIGIIILFLVLVDPLSVVKASIYSCKSIPLREYVIKGHITGQNDFTIYDRVGQKLMYTIIYDKNTQKTRAKIYSYYPKRHMIAKIRRVPFDDNLYTNEFQLLVSKFNDTAKQFKYGNIEEVRQTFGRTGEIVYDTHKIMMKRKFGSFHFKYIDAKTNHTLAESRKRKRSLVLLANT
ncbi:unnamed protein product, partial [Didymodactylos carnosus]